MLRITIILLILIITTYGFSQIKPENLHEYQIIIKNHRFEPHILEIPANAKVRLNIYNQDDSVEEFESFDLKREKIVPAHGHIKIVIGPLELGEYKFFGEFHEHTAQGKIKVK